MNVKFLVSLLLLLPLAAGGGCRDESRKKEASAVQASAQAPAADEIVRILFDGDEVALVSKSSIAERIALTDVLPEDKRDGSRWLQVEGLAKVGNRLAIPEPSVRYKDHTAYLYRNKKDDLCLGWFMREADGDTRPRVPRLKLVNVAEIRIVTAAAPRGESARGLTVRVKGQAPVNLDAQALRALPVFIPDGEAEERAQNRRLRGWKLLDVVGLATQDLDSLVSVTVSGEGGAQQTFTAAQLKDTQGFSITVKRNKRGLLMVRWPGPDGKRQEVRGARTIDLESRSR